jgi:hypothetical protein
MNLLAAVTDFFVNPWLLTGMLLIAAPIILHLLNKRRFEVVEWAVMDFLFDAQTQNRRRMRLEDLLLLLLRILGIACLVLAFSRPLVTGLSGGSEDARVVVVDNSFSMEAVDGATNLLSLARSEARGLIEEAVARSIPLDVYRGSAPAGERWSAAARLGRVEGAVASDSSEETALVGETADTARYERASGLLDKLGTLEASDLPLGLPAVLSAVGERLGADDEPGARSIFVISDLRQGDWFEKDGTTLRRDLQAVLEDLAGRKILENLRLECVPVGGPNRENLSVVEFRPRTDRPLVGHPIQVVIKVKNFGARPRTALRGWLEVGSPSPNSGDSSGAGGRSGGGGGMFLAQQRVPLETIPSVGAGESATATAEFQVEVAGSYPLRVQFDGDLLPRDDRNFAVLDVRRGTRVLLVDGSPGAGRFGGETGFLKTALAPRGDVSSGVLVREHTGELRPEDLLDTDVVLLLNHKGVTAAEREALERFVEFGGGLGFFLGNQVRVEDYARAFGPAAGGAALPGVGRTPGNGTGVVLFPAKLSAFPVRGARPDGGLFHLAVADWSHPALAVFRGVEGSSLERVGFSRFLGLEAAPGTTVVARFDDAAGTPAIVEVTRVRHAVAPGSSGDGAGGSDEGSDGVGDDGGVAASDVAAEPGEAERAEGASDSGRVVIFNVTADRDWGDWPRDPSYPIAMQEWVKYLAPRRALQRTVTAAEPLLWRTHPGVHYEVLLPDGRTRAIPATAHGWASFEETERAGFYCVMAKPADPRLKPPAGALEPVWFASRRDVRESDLEPAAEERLVEALSDKGLTAVVHDRAGGGQSDVAANAGLSSGGGHKLWRWCALGLGILLVLELVVAWWFGRRSL